MADIKAKSGIQPTGDISNTDITKDFYISRKQFGPISNFSFSLQILLSQTTGISK